MKAVRRKIGFKVKEIRQDKGGGGENMPRGKLKEIIKIKKIKVKRKLNEKKIE